jgi:Asp-tRNA(Asn)/Glu-tRNA(Gln) amidotransferase A subunit family amidase
MPSRRQFIRRAALGVAALAVDKHARAAEPAPPPSPSPTSPPSPPGSPPTFGNAPAVGPKVTPATFAEAEKLAQVQLTPGERAQAAHNWREAMAPTLERRTGPRKVPLPDGLAPGTRWDPRLPGVKLPVRDRFVASRSAVPPLPTRDEDIAHAPLTWLAAWVQSRKLPSLRLTELYLDRLQKFQPQLLCTITLTKELALEQAKQADAELARGKSRGPLHGIPYGAKDLIDTAGIATTYGAEPFRDRVPATDAIVIRRLRDAGAVLVAKLSLGALALNDVWFGGQTKNPWLLDEGSSGSSAGPGAATAAGLVGFSIGSETDGSIISPSLRCGVAGLRPTFGRVARTGAMTLAWSTDKLGPMCRGVEDTMLVLRAITGPDPSDVSSVPSVLDYDGNQPVRGLRVGYVAKWMKEPPATSVDEAALELLQKAGLETVPVTLPDWPYASLITIIFAESAASFEELTLSHGLDQLKMQVDDAWPNTMRQARFLSAVDLVQAERLRRKVAEEMARLFERVDVLLVPSVRDEMLTITNFTGHPALALRTGFIEVERIRSDWAPNPAHTPEKLTPPRRVPHGPTLIGRLFDEGTIARVGLALERAANVARERPPGF